jgi:hypothetical protein
MPGGPARSLCLLVEPHQLLHQLRLTVVGDHAAGRPVAVYETVLWNDG